MPETTYTTVLGTLLWRAPDGEYGLVRPNDREGLDLLVHRSDMVTDPQAAMPAEGDAVLYELCTDAQGPRARSVRRRT
ncbi:cold-shock protein [Streptomyces sp. NBC_01264]|uniref:cold-shock protein n=1 Tax=Streptomyces sp. NBC_01264 TaxID=2903804 RepID=UPI00225416F6|nr:cold shock domain-containing protein [Streptomyces sp. NBC_01264]MCX4781823.1 cold shock domain-containing protein [Streptomyces sp. NBC_01264]